MCRLLTLNLDRICAASHSTVGSGDNRKCVRERCGSNRQLRKKLSFSRALKSNSESACQSAMGNSPKATVTLADSHSPGNYSIPQSNEQIPSTSPSPSVVVALGLVRQADLPLTWLNPTSVCSCTGLYVPRETRNSHCSLPRNERYQSLHGDVIQDETTCNSKTSDSPVAITSSGTMKVADRTPEPPNVLHHVNTSAIPPCTPPSVSSPYYHGLNISPVVRLDKCPFSPPNSCQSVPPNRMRRTASVPSDEVYCSADSLVPELVASDAKMLKKMKSSHSLPSSPVVLCTKLPLQDHSYHSSHGMTSSSTSRQNFAIPLPVIISPKLLQLKVSNIQESRTAGSQEVPETSEEHSVS